MKVYQLMDNVTMESTIRFVWYDYDTDKLHEISEKEANPYEIKYMYAENDVIVIEIDMGN